MNERKKWEKGKRIERKNKSEGETFPSRISPRSKRKVEICLKENYSTIYGKSSA